MLKVWNFAKNKLCHRCIDNNLQKIFRTNILENGTRFILLIVFLLVDVWLKLQIETVEWNHFIFTCLPFIQISVWILRAVMHQSPKAHLGPSQASKINLFARIVNVFKLTLLTIFVKSTIMDVWRALITPLTYSNKGN